jgi:HAD superfamily hydrolase (TIGR01509 family)
VVNGHPPAAVVFDNDGLLCDTEESWSRAEERLFERYGRRWTDDHKREIMGSSGARAGALLAAWLDQPGRDRELMAEVVELVHEEIEAGVELRHGARDLLEALTAAGTPFALASNSSRRFIDEVLERAGISELLPVTVSAAEVAASKPAPDVYLEAARRLGAQPTECLAFEDSPTGVLAGKAAGMTVIGIPSIAGMRLAPPADAEHLSLAEPAVWAACGLAPARHA